MADPSSDNLAPRRKEIKSQLGESDAPCTPRTSHSSGGPGSSGGHEADNHTGLSIARDGTWYYHGSPILRKEMVTLFASALARHDDGSFWIETGVECGRVTVEDAPFTAVGLTVEGRGKDQVLSFHTNVGDSVAADAQHPIRILHDSETGNPSPYVEVRDGLEALIARPVYYELVELGEETDGPDGRVVGVWSGGSFFPLGVMEAA